MQEKQQFQAETTKSCHVLPKEKYKRLKMSRSPWLHPLCTILLAFQTPGIAPKARTGLTGVTATLSKLHYLKLSWFGG